MKTRFFHEQWLDLLQDTVKSYDFDENAFVNKADYKEFNSNYSKTNKF